MAGARKTSKAAPLVCRAGTFPHIFSHISVLNRFGKVSIQRQRAPTSFQDGGANHGGGRGGGGANRGGGRGGGGRQPPRAPSEAVPARLGCFTNLDGCFSALWSEPGWPAWPARVPAAVAVCPPRAAAVAPAAQPRLTPAPAALVPPLWWWTRDCWAAAALPADSVQPYQPLRCQQASWHL